MAVRSVRREKFKFKWTKELVFLIVGLLAVIITTICLALPTKEDKFLDRWASANLPRESVLSEISEKSLVNKINKKSDYVFVFYGTPDDEESVKNIQTVQTKATALKIDHTVYWLDATDTFKTKEDIKNSKDFKDEIERREKDLKDVDLLKYGSLWIFDKEGNLVLDSSTFDNGESFEVVITKGFGDYKKSLQEAK